MTIDFSSAIIYGSNIIDLKLINFTLFDSVISNNSAVLQIDGSRGLLDITYFNLANI